MYSCPPCANNAIPGEYRNIAEALFPPAGFPGERGPGIETIGAFAEILGISGDYQKLLNASPGKLDDFLLSFQNNLDLLIQKTWVEKADEIRKERLQDGLPSFIEDIKKGDYVGALEKFGVILEELAYLFFGAQSHKDDFTEYTFRIDPQMGLFWWYGGQIGCPGKNGWIKTAGAECLKGVLLLGICYLTDF
jgi:hypothetical protein